MERIPPVVDRKITGESNQQPVDINSPIMRLQADPQRRVGVRLPGGVLRSRFFMPGFRGPPRFNDRHDTIAHPSFQNSKRVLSRLPAAESPLLTDQLPRKTFLEEKMTDADDNMLPVSRLTRPLRLSRVEKLPYELFLELLDHLDLHDEYFLSCTSRTMRQTVRELRKMDDWSARVSRLSRRERLKFLTGIAYIVPDKWTCKACCTLHQVDQSDFPLVKDDPVYDHLSNNRAQYACPLGVPSSVVIASHEFHYAHVQMALKLNRMGMTDHPYYEKLMRVNECPAALLSRHDRLCGSHSMIPKIVNGRFLFQTKVILNFGPRTHRFEDLHRLWVRRKMCACGSRATYDYFQRDGGGRLEPGEAETMLYCASCRTECSVVVNGTEFAITFWYDLGAYGSPEDFPWTNDQASWSMRVRDDGLMSSAPGSVRELWEQYED